MRTRAVAREEAGTYAHAARQWLAPIDPDTHSGPALLHHTLPAPSPAIVACPNALARAKLKVTAPAPLRSSIRAVKTAAVHSVPRAFHRRFTCRIARFFVFDGIAFRFDICEARARV